jgi:hypothetical protein
MLFDDAEDHKESKLRTHRGVLFGQFEISYRDGNTLQPTLTAPSSFQWHGNPPNGVQSFR